MDETLVLAALCAKRGNYDAIIRLSSPSDTFSEAARSVFACADEQYKRDESLGSVDKDILRSQITRRYGEGQQTDSILDFVATFPTDVSGANVAEELRLLRLARVATHLATLLATGQTGDATDEALKQYQDLASGAATGDDRAPRLTMEDFEEESASRIQLSPSRLNDFIGGGILRGHNVTVYGRPDSGKSLFGLNQAAFTCKQGGRVLYVANEEPAQDITRRVLARLAGCDVNTLRDRSKLQQAFDRAGDAYDNFYIYHEAGATMRDVSAQCYKYQPDMIIVDQLKNISCHNDNRALQLDTLARGVRELGIGHNAATISITQAGESAEGKLVLSMTDIEWSNTGIPGAADLLIGIGVDQEYLAQDKRMFSIPKNKINGRHGHVPVWIDPARTAFLSKARV
jgi:replicative DNA helicase